MKLPALPTLPLDGWDLAAIAGLALVALGVRALAGWPWAAIVVGTVVLTAYVVVNVIVARARLAQKER